MTTGAGGFVVSNHADWAEHAKHLSTQAKAICCNFCMMKSATTTA